MSRLVIVNKATREEIERVSSGVQYKFPNKTVVFPLKAGFETGDYRAAPIVRANSAPPGHRETGRTGQYDPPSGNWVETVQYAPRPPRPINEQQVKDECSRRLRLLFRLGDADSLENVIRDATQEAVELLDLIAGGGEWTAEQAARAEYLRQGRALVNAHDAASKAIRALNPIPEDYADNSRWPPLPAQPEEEVTP
jgi:hypothetical protein